MAITPVNIDNFQQIEAVVTGPGAANRLFIFTGVAIFTFQGTSDKFIFDFFDVEVGPIFQQGQVINVLATGSLNSIANGATAVNAGWAVDRLTARFDPVEGRIKLRADVGVSDTDGFLFRVGFQITVLAKV